MVTFYQPLYFFERLLTLLYLSIDWQMKFVSDIKKMEKGLYTILNLLYALEPILNETLKACALFAHKYNKLSSPHVNF